MQLKDVMTASVTTIPVTATVAQASELMASHGIGFLPVIHERVCAGVLTEGDIAERVTGAGRDAAATMVGEVMSHHHGLHDVVGSRANEAIISLPAEAPVEEAARLMNEQHIHRLAVHDEELRIVGIVSTSDLTDVVSRTP